MRLKSSLLVVAAAIGGLCAQPAAVDTLLFTIALSDDSGSIFFSDWTDDLRSSLAGPVMMSGGTLLFHSKNGYVLYDMSGKLLEEHSLAKANRTAAAAGKPQTYLAYPFDSESVIYYTDSNPVEVFRKKLHKKTLDKVPTSEMEMFKNIKTSEPLNIYRSGTNEDIGRKTFLMPHLAGFTALEGGSKWWSADMFFSFMSPMIMETNGHFTSFFNGLREGGSNCDIPVKLIEPLGVSSRDGRWYYLGLHSKTGSKEEETFQTIVLCDHAGNILYCSQLQKQEMADAVLDRRRNEDGIMIEYTVKRPGRHTFIPSVDSYGDLFYGTIAWEWKKLEVRKRSFVRFVSKPAAPAFADLFAREEAFEYLPVKVECSNASRRGVIPEIVIKEKSGSMHLLDKDELVNDSLFALVHRLPNEDLKKKISRVSHTLPPHIGAMQDSISKLPTTWCPYGISLNHVTKGTLSNLDYGFGEIVVCARVLGRSQSKNIYVRVDLETWAEIVVFTPDGKFLERFTFNNRHYKDRRDIVALSVKDEIYERDYEATAAQGGKKSKAPAGFKFVVWTRGIGPLKAPPPAQSAKPAKPPAKKKR